MITRRNESGIDQNLGSLIPDLITDSNLGRDKSQGLDKVHGLQQSIDVGPRHGASLAVAS
jgi:hypothetical protein